MTARQFSPHETPYFSYDRNWTTTDIQSRLVDPGSRQWIDTTSWIMREAAFPDVWFFVTPTQVAQYLEQLAPRLGKKQDFWRYIIGAWRELGKLESTDAA